MTKDKTAYSKAFLKAFEDFKRTPEYLRYMTIMFENDIFNPVRKNILLTAFKAGWKAKTNNNENTAKQTSIKSPQPQPAEKGGTAKGTAY
jgi:hypothetical protein